MVADPLAILGMPNCAAGALFVAGLFAIVLGTLELGRGIAGCTR